jgi:ribosomal 50S subunit-recycling heat shock protein
MVRKPTWLTPVLVLVAAILVCAPVVAGEKIKSVSADQKEFVITNQDGKDVTLQLADNARIILPDGKEGSAKDLKAGQEVSFLWEEKGGKYIATAVLENRGNLKDAMLASVTIKKVGADTGELVVTDATNKDWTFQIADKAKVSVNRKEAKASDLKAGDKAILAYEKKGAKLSVLDICTDKR